MMSTSAPLTAISSDGSFPSPTSHAPPVSATCRPPRKSTLTQQQKNNKRQRATQEQLATLELEFNKNPTPTAATRDKIAQDINMTERSVQIWFQNRLVRPQLPICIYFPQILMMDDCSNCRRAKIKVIAKRSIESGEGCEAIPEPMRQYLAMYFDPSKQSVRDPLGRVPGFAVNGMYPTELPPSGKVGELHGSCRP